MMEGMNESRRFEDADLAGVGGSESRAAVVMVSWVSSPAWRELMDEASSGMRATLARESDSEMCPAAGRAEEGRALEVRPNLEKAERKREEPDVPSWWLEWIDGSRKLVAL